jgi:Xaa-Pro aminopeptidase
MEGGTTGEGNVVEARTAAARLGRAQELLRDRGVDALIVCPSADMRYLLRYGGHASERPTFLVIAPSLDPLIVMPQLEASRLVEPPARVLAYGETENPYAVLARAIDGLPLERVALTDQTWSVVLLRLQERFPGTSFAPAGPLLRSLRMAKSTDEVELLRRAAAAADAAFEELVSRRFSGRTEREIAGELGGLLESGGLELTVWRPIVASGPNSASPHHMTGDRRIREGDAVILDFGGEMEGYQADISRTVHVGEAGDEFPRVYDAVRAGQQAGVQAVHPGASAGSVDAAARQSIEDAGYGAYFIHRTGHGVGLDVHEEPYIVEGNELKLEPGMTFSVEPGVYLPGRFGVRIEDIVAVTQSSGERLNQASRDLQIVR